MTKFFHYFCCNTAFRWIDIHAKKALRSYPIEQLVCLRRYSNFVYMANAYPFMGRLDLKLMLLFWRCCFRNILISSLSQYTLIPNWSQWLGGNSGCANVLFSSLRNQSTTLKQASVVGLYDSKSPSNSFTHSKKQFMTTSICLSCCLH